MDNLPRLGQAFHTVITLRTAKGLPTSYADLTALFEADNFGKLHIFKSQDDEPIGYISYSNIDPYHHQILSPLTVKALGIELSSPAFITFITDVMWKEGVAASASAQLRQFIRERKIIAFAREGKIFCKMWCNSFRTIRL